jgi:hypothetical protein
MQKKAKNTRKLKNKFIEFFCFLSRVFADFAIKLRELFQKIKKSGKFSISKA